MPRARPISLNVMPDDGDTAHVVLQAYRSARDQKAFDAAVQAWREQHPDTTPEQGAKAVAVIICNSL